MKKITSILLLVSLLISILYIPGAMMNVAADEPAKHTLPDGTEMVEGKYVFHEGDRLPSEGELGGEIKSAEDLKEMQPGGKYSLAANITLSGWDPLFKSIPSGADGIRFDGGGYTIKTDNMIFARIPKNSTFANFVIEGTAGNSRIGIEAIFSDVNNYPEKSYASLCGVAHGGTFKNIINKGYVTTQGESATTPYYFRVAGLIGTCNDSTVLVQNCLNKGRVWSTVHGTDCAVAGMVAYSTVTLYLIKCRNDGQIKNTAVSNQASQYASGILGVKSNDSKVQIIDCSTVKSTDKASNGEDMIMANTRSGAGYDGCTAIENAANVTYDPKAIPVRSAEDFANMSGNNNYYLLESFRVVEQNKNVFTGTIYGATRRIDSDIPHFAHHINESQCNSLALKVEGGYKKIMTAYEFYEWIQNSDLENNKFYLGADIDLTKYTTNWKGPKYWEDNREKAKNGEIPIILDGCGYTITTNKPIFVELPGGGDPKNETHSIMRNIVIAGNVTVSQAELASYNGSSYDNGYSVGALVGKTNGGIFDNIINKASVTYNGNTNARVGGIVGSTFNDDLFMINCVNNGLVTAKVHGERYGVGGIIGLVGYNGDSTDAGVTANLNNCVNKAEVKNNSNNDFYVYAGGVVGVKFQNQTVVCLRDCDSTGTVRAKTAYGKYCADRLQQNFHIIRTK